MTNRRGCDRVPPKDSPHTTASGESENVVHDYCIQMWDAMKKASTKDQYVGSITQVYKTLGISNQYYSQILRALVETGSVEHVQRGHHKRPSIYRLIHRPTKAQLSEHDFLTPRSKRDKVSEDEILKRIEELERRVGKIEVVPALTNIEGRLRALENATKK